MLFAVYPWVLTDYKSDTIDLTDPAVYRDLSKPIGALNEDRFEIFNERYQVSAACTHAHTKSTHTSTATRSSSCTHSIARSTS